MTSAAESKQDASQQESIDRRRGMKLVATSGGRSGFRINIANDLFTDCDLEGRDLRVERIDRAANKKKSNVENDSPGRDGQTVPAFGRLTTVLASAAIIGLILGYLAGRSRD